MNVYKLAPDDVVCKYSYDSGWSNEAKRRLLNCNDFLKKQKEEEERRKAEALRKQKEEENKRKAEALRKQKEKKGII